jgi:hypothetical protein
MIIDFGKYKGMDIRDPTVETSYIEWYIGVKTDEGRTRGLKPWKEELAHRTGKEDSVKWGGYTGEDEGPVEEPVKQQAITSITPPKTVEPPEKQPEQQLTEDLMVFSKKKIEELVVSAYTRGYNDSYARLSVNIRAIPYVQTFNIQRFKQELLSSLQENRPIDTMKYDESPKTEKQVDGGNDKESSRKSWYSQDNRK